jgi:hypothetical protein
MELNEVAAGLRDEVDALLRVSDGVGQIRGPSNEQLVAWGAWVQAAETAAAVCALTRVRGPVRAPLHALARPLWEGSLVLRWVARDRVARFPIWEGFSAKQALRWWRHPVMVGGTQFPLGETKQLQLTEEWLKERAPHGRGYPNLEKQAKEAGMEGSYTRVYRPLCASVHWHLFAMKEQARGGDTYPERPLAVAACHFWMALVDCHGFLGLPDDAVVRAKPKKAWEFLYPNGLGAPTD